MKKGFTLVELSIVLVIIGLLIGGILAAQSMISTARITSQIKQIQQYDIAITNFKTKYNSLPGDTTIAFAGVTSGNNDGIINDCGGGSPGFYTSTCEFANFWKELSLIGAISDGAIYSNYGDMTPGIYEPLAKLSSKSISGKANLGLLAYGIASTGLNYYDIIAGPIPSYVYTASLSMLPVDLASLDTKMDDSLPGSGSVVARSVNTTISDPAVIGVGNGCLLNVTSYKVNNAVATCVARITMMSQTGSN